MNNISESPKASDAIVLVLNPSATHQSIEGFGGAVTDSAAINWESLKDSKTRQHLIE